ncbi:MAG TPA: peptidoglycan DD-metalloendopeptidase family protein [Saprospiraceae bacterium]|nr:peptidoglycan DD-metalloendopeptidase family protein [Saprospiraceae bacterium]
MKYPIIMSGSNDIRLAICDMPPSFHRWRFANRSDIKKRGKKNECLPKIAFCFVIFLLLLPLCAFSQSKKELEDKRKKLLRDIEMTGGLLKKTTKTKEATYDRYVALQSQIERREKLIQNIEDEIAGAEKGIDRNAAVIDALNRDIVKMQVEYGRMVRSAFRRKMLSNPLLYILSADNLNQAFRRWLFLRKYDDFRKEQADAIADTKEMLSKKVVALEETRREKETLLMSLRGQKTILSTEMADKNNMLQTLSEDENRLKAELKKKQAAHEALNQAIERVIQEEITRRTAEARRTRPAQPAQPNNSRTNTAPGNAKPAESAPEVVVDNTSLAFQQKRGQLPWPVDDGFISRAYGRQKHPTLKNIEITNNGIDIRTNDAAAVRAVYEGKVAGVQFIPGHDNTVIIQHGNYYTVYSNLSETSVAKGDAVRARQVIGRVSTNSITGASELHFELWNQKERMNPEGWIRK